MRFLLPLTVASLLVGCSATHAAGGQAAAIAEVPSQQTHATAITPEEIVAGRRAAFLLSTRAVGQIKAWTEGAGEQRDARTAALMLANWADAMPGMFPEGSDIEGSRALPAIWTDREGFEARAADYAVAARSLAGVIAEGDRAAADAAFLEMAATCHACHEQYRAADGN